MDADSAVGAIRRDVRIPVGDRVLDGTLDLPAGATSVIVFAHGSGSSRQSPRNILVAETIRAAGLGTLLFDLLTPEEDAADRRTAQFRFDIALLARRLEHATAWLLGEWGYGRPRIGYFGASTGAAAALVAAASMADDVGAVVSRGGRPDMAGSALGIVQAPTLLIVGGADPTVLELNQQAQAQMRAHTELVVIPGATHLFEEPGALDRVARLAADWFVRYLLDVAA
ncbi:MAG: DeoR family transcriptional regulator [Chloroflexi bacterium]|nr:DeoR family transcriptional regulator [Chloroflexota bacterium]